MRDEFLSHLIVGILCLVAGGVFGAILATPESERIVGAEDRDKFWEIIVEACDKQGKVPGLITETDPDGWQRVNVGCKNK